MVSSLPHRESFLIVNAQADALNSTLAGLAKSPKSEISTDNYQSVEPTSRLISKRSASNQLVRREWTGDSLERQALSRMAIEDWLATSEV